MKKKLLAATLGTSLALGMVHAPAHAEDSASTTTTTTSESTTTTTTSKSKSDDTDVSDLAEGGLLSMTNYLKLKGLWQKPWVQLLAGIVIMVSAIVTAVNAGIYGARYFHIYIPGVSE